MEPVCYGIIGVDQITQKGHLPELLKISEAEVVAIADINPEMLQQLQKELPSPEFA